MAESCQDGASSKLELGKCEVCQNERAKYTCPRCEVKTCSLKCVKIHKLELVCNGERAMAAYKPLSKFTNIDLLSDYRLMEKISRSVDAYQRNPAKRFTRTKRELPYHLNQLRIAAMKRGCRLTFLPQNFTRHKTNTTVFDWKKNVIFWRVGWTFPQADNLVMHSERLLETEKMSRCVSQFLNPDVESNPALQFYQAAGCKGIKLLLKAEGIRKSNSRFYELDLSMSLKTNLRNKFIVECPIIWVILKDHESMYSIIDSDEEEEVTDVCFPGNIRGPLREPKPSVSKPKNLLFDDDISNSGSEDEIEEVKKAPKQKKLDIPSYDVLVQQSSS